MSPIVISAGDDGKVSDIDQRAADGSRGAGRRFPRRVYDVGDEPDPRFSLANERTFLAWIRTSIGLIAAGVALEALAAPVQPALRLGASVLLILAGVIAPAQAWSGWAKTERAMRLGRPLPAPRLAILLAVIVVAGCLVLIGTLLGR